MATIYLWVMLWTLLVANIVAAAVNFAGSRVDMGIVNTASAVWVAVVMGMAADQES